MQFIPFPPTLNRRVGALAFAGALALAGCGGSSDGADSATTVATTSTAGGDDATTGPSSTTPDVGSSDSVAVDESAPESASADTAPGTTTAAGAEQTAEEVKQAIVSISPTATEMLYEIGAGDQVIAVDTLSNYPPEAVNKQTGIEAFTPNVEAIAALEPDLVVSDGSNPDFIAQLDELKIDHWEGPAATGLSDVYDQIEQLGAVTGKVAEAASVVMWMQNDIDSIVAGAPEGKGLTYYHELDNTYYSATSGTFIGQVYEMFQMTNIADEADGADTGYPQLSAEYIIDANPDLIFLACGEFCGDTPTTVAARPGWDQIAAVKDGGVIELDADIASRWGPRVVDLVQYVADALDTVTAGADA